MTHHNGRFAFHISPSPRPGTIIDHTSNNGKYRITADRHNGMDMGLIRIFKDGQKVLDFEPSMMIYVNLITDEERKVWASLPSYVVNVATTITGMSRAQYRNA